MAKNLNTATIGTTWTDLAVVSGLTEIAGATCMIQNQSQTAVHVVFSTSASEPGAGVARWSLLPYGTTSGTASHVWAKADAAGAQIAVGLTD